MMKVISHATMILLLTTELTVALWPVLATQTLLHCLLACWLIFTARRTYGKTADHTCTAIHIHTRMCQFTIGHTALTLNPSRHTPRRSRRQSLAWKWRLHVIYYVTTTHVCKAHHCIHLLWAACFEACIDWVPGDEISKYTQTYSTIHCHQSMIDWSSVCTYS